MSAGDAPSSRTSSSISTGAGPNRLQDFALQSVGVLQLPTAVPSGFGFSCDSAMWCGRKAVQNVLGALGQDRALAEQAVRALGPRVERGARHGEDIAALFAGEAGGDERARIQRCLDYDHAARKARDDAVAAREMLGGRLMSHRHFGDNDAAFAAISS